jgi:hypothetical protein
LSAPNQQQRRNDFLFDRNDRLGVDHAAGPAAAGTRLFAGDAVAAGRLECTVPATSGRDDG